MELNLNTKEAVQYLSEYGLRFSAGTFEVWRSIGRGPRFKRICRKVYYRQSDLDEFARGQIVETSESINTK